MWLKKLGDWKKGKENGEWRGEGGEGGKTCFVAAASCLALPAPRGAAVFQDLRNERRRRRQQQKQQLFRENRPSGKRRRRRGWWGKEKSCASGKKPNCEWCILLNPRLEETDRQNPPLLSCAVRADSATLHKKISAPPAILSKNLWRCCECSIYPVVRTTLGVWTVQSQISALAKMLQAKKRCYYLSQLMGFRRSTAEDFLHMQFMALHKKPSNSTKGFAKSGEQLCFCKEDEIKRGSKSSFFGKTPLVSISSPSSSLFKASTHVIRYRQGPPLLQNGEGRVQASPPPFPPYSSSRSFSTTTYSNWFEI